MVPVQMLSNIQDTTKQQLHPNYPHRNVDRNGQVKLFARILQDLQKSLKILRDVVMIFEDSGKNCEDPKLVDPSKIH